MKKLSSAWLRQGNLDAAPVIHLLSDVHLESGPYQLPEQLNCDIVVAAGDIGPVEQSVPFLASLGKPVVYVMGNHEYWGESLDAVVAKAKVLAAGTQVHVLERESVVLGGIRFLGATLWTDFGANEALAMEAHRRMRDYGQISLEGWNPSNAERRAVERAAHALGFANRKYPWKQPEKFHPAVAYVRHQQTVRWLERELSKNAGKYPTVVVSHHAPSYECLRASGVHEDLLKPENWDRRYRDDKLVYVGAYASDLRSLLGRHRDEIALWCHGHIHKAQDLLVEGVRVLSNPRGRYIAPLTKESARGFALFGMHVTDEDIERSQALARAEPYRGDGRDFDNSLLVKLADGQARPLSRLLAKPLERLTELTQDCESLLPVWNRGREKQKAAVKRWFLQNCNEFTNYVQETLTREVLSHLDQYASTVALSVHWGAPAQPYMPWDEEEQTLEAARECTTRMRHWLETLNQLPSVARQTQVKRSSAVLKAVELLRVQAPLAEIATPPWASWRRIDQKEIAVRIAPSDESELERLEWALDKALNPTMPRSWHLRVVESGEEWGAFKQSRWLPLKKFSGRS